MPETKQSPATDSQCQWMDCEYPVWVTCCELGFCYKHYGYSYHMPGHRAFGSRAKREGRQFLVIEDHETVAVLEVLGTSADTTRMIDDLRARLRSVL